MRERIQAWLVDEGWTIRQETVPEADWSLVAESRQGVKINVRQLSGHSDQALVFGAIKVAEDLAKRLTALPAEERREFLWDLRFRLLDLGVEFDGIQEVLDQVIVGTSIYGDGITKDAFMQRTVAIHSATLAVLWMLARKFSQAAPERTMGLIP